MKRTPAIVFAAASVAGITITGTGAMAFAQTTSTTTPATSSADRKPPGFHADLLAHLTD